MALFSQNFPFGQSEDYVEDTYVAKFKMKDIPCEHLDMVCFDYNSRESRYLKGWYLTYSFINDQMFAVTKTYDPTNGENIVPGWNMLTKMYSDARKRLIQKGFVVKVDTVVNSDKYAGCTGDSLSECGYEYQAVIDGSMEVYSIYQKDSIQVVVAIDVGPYFMKCNPIKEKCNDYFNSHLTVSVEYRHIPLFQLYRKQRDSEFFQ